MARESIAPRTRVEELMQARGLTQRDISERADWNPSTINRIVSGQKAMSAGARRTLARILQCAEADLIQTMGSPVPPLQSAPSGSNQQPQDFADRLAALLAVTGLHDLEAVARFLLAGDFSKLPTGMASRLRSELDPEEPMPEDHKPPPGECD